MKDPTLLEIEEMEERIVPEAAAHPGHPNPPLNRTKDPGCEATGSAVSTSG
jgi:hypothetical protein